MSTEGGTMEQVEQMLRAYVECALWSSTDAPAPGEANGEPLDANYGPDDLSREAIVSMREDCTDFLTGCGDDIKAGGQSMEQVGHDFWLTRNGHGAGFWDRGLGDVGERLTAMAKPYGESDLYVGDDGLLYVTP